MELRPFALVPIVLSFAGVAASQSRLPVWKVQGGQANAGLGSAASSAGDVNGDGFDDVFVGAFAYSGDLVREGRVQVFHGGVDGPSKEADWLVEGDQAYATLGGAGVGDVNSDGYGDVMVTSYMHSNGEYLEGAAWLYLGSATGLAATPVWSAEGEQQNVNFGAAVAAAGDVDGDGFGDVLVGVGQYMNGQQAEGRALLYLGSATGLAAAPIWSAEGNQGFCGFGNVAGAGDVNADGYDDVLVGASAFDAGERDEGRAYLYLGSPAGPSALPNWTVEANRRDAFLGSGVACAGDVNGDGYDDVLVGAPGYDEPPVGFFGNDGRAYLYLGSAAGLAPTPAWFRDGVQEGESLGSSVAGIGDVDGDGYDDVAIGAQGFDGGLGLRSEGRAFVHYGSALGLTTLPGWRVAGDQQNASLGWPIGRAGDVNGDGYDDLLIGVNLLDVDLHDEGAALVFLGASRQRAH